MAEVPRPQQALADILGSEFPVFRPIQAKAADQAAMAQAQNLGDYFKAKVENCRDCGLWKDRLQAVFGEGPDHPQLMMVGEGPGLEEDRQGRPFVGPAGELLDKMIQAMGMKREEIYIANAVKCHPAGVPPAQNRPPSPDEIQACRPHLEFQIQQLKPRMILALGRSAAQSLGLGEGPLASLRGRTLQALGFPLRVTYHPSALLRPGPRQKQMKRDTWEDLKYLMADLGRELPAEKP